MLLYEHPDLYTGHVGRFSMICRKGQSFLPHKIGMGLSQIGFWTFPLYERHKKPRASLNIRRAEACEKIFRQSKQKSARIVDPIRRIFVTISERSSGGKDSVKISCDEFLEVP